MKKVFLFASAAVALLASCSSEDNLSNVPTNEGKEKIQFAAGDDQKAFVTRAGFSEKTKIVAHFVSDPRTDAPDGSAKEFTKTYLSALVAEDLTEAGFSKVEYVSGYDRYWDDAHGRYSRLSVYAVAVPNKETITKNSLELTGSAGATWEDATSVSNKLTWSVSDAQTSTILADEDLAYSNNISKSGSNGVYKWDFNQGKYNDASPSDAAVNSYGSDPVVNDGRMFFTQADKSVNDDITSAAGHFQKGHMEFHHALSRIQIKIVKGSGYGETGFTFDAGNIKLYNMPYTGTFNVENGEWASTSSKTIASIAKLSSETDAVGTYEAQVVPGYNFAGTATDNALEFTIGGNTYYVTNGQLKSALEGNTTVFKMEQGNRYIFTITVDKTLIKNITATIVDWNKVTADEFHVDNSHYYFNFYKDGDNVTTDVNLYKYEQTLGALATGGDYSAPAVASSADPAITYSAVKGFQIDGTTDHFTSSEYFKDNKTAYHFRSVNNAAKATLNDTELTQEDQIYFTMSSGNTDYLWGAPMKTSVSTDKLPYNLTNGYLSSIEKGIVAANTTAEENYINLTQLHMMSKLVVKLTTPTDGSGVTLTGATVTLTNLSETGTVNLGSGLVTPSIAYNDHAAVSVSQVGETGVYSCTLNVIPQLLNRGTGETGYVGITIHTADNNEYYIIKNLSDIVGTEGSEITNMQTNSAKITRWYPGHEYTYTFNISKKKIEVITATIVPWNPVNAGSTNLDLEK